MFMNIFGLPRKLKVNLSRVQENCQLSFTTHPFEVSKYLEKGTHVTNVAFEHGAKRAGIYHQIKITL